MSLPGFCRPAIGASLLLLGSVPALAGPDDPFTKRKRQSPNHEPGLPPEPEPIEPLPGPGIPPQPRPDPPPGEPPSPRPGEPVPQQDPGRVEPRPLGPESAEPSPGVGTRLEVEPL